MSIEELTVEATHRCPLHCIHCSSHLMEGELGVSEIEEAICRFDPRVVRWSGGEPFEYLTAEHLEIPGRRRQMVTTSGHYRYAVESFADFFDEVRVSLYGRPSFHDAVTGVSASFLRASFLISDLGRKGVDVTITSPVWSEGQGEEVKTLAKRFGVPYRLTRLVPDVGAGTGNTCSTGDAPCRREDKRLLLPDGSVVKCAVEKRGFMCPNMEGL